MNRRLAVCAALVLQAAVSSAAPAEDSPAWLGGQLYQENDSLIAGDERYTQGLRISLVRLKPPRLVVKMGDALSGRLWSDSLKFNPGFSVVFGQNMYTPEVITARDHHPGDRGFAGVLYGGIQAQFTEEGQTARHTFEAYAGLTGELSLAGPAQSGLHVLRFRRIPKGWESAPETVVVNTYYRLERRFAACNAAQTCFADVTGGGLVSLGNIQTAAGLHAAARVGYGLTGFPAAAIANAVGPRERPGFEIGAIAGWEGRALAYNGLLRPHLADGRFSREPLVDDRRYGGYARYKDVRLTVQKVRRSPEFLIDGDRARSQTFASISLSYEPLDGSPSPGRPWPVRDWRLGLGLGAALVGPSLDRGGRGGGPAGAAGFGKGLGKGVVLGFEIGGMAVEDEPPTTLADSHNDVFLIYRAVTLGWAPRFARGVVLRAGPTLLRQVGKVENIDNGMIGGRPAEDITARYYRGGRWGWIGSLQYLRSLQRPLAIAVGATWCRLDFESDVPGVSKPAFLIATIGFEVRP